MHLVNRSFEDMNTDEWKNQVKALLDIAKSQESFIDEFLYGDKKEKVSESGDE